MPSDPRIRITGNATEDLDRLGRQYEELDRAFGVPDPAAPVNGMSPEPQRPLEPYEQALELLDTVRRQAMDTATLGRLEELINALEVLYGAGVAYPLRDALGTLGAAMNHAWADLGRARRLVLDDVTRLKAAVESWASDYRTVDRMAQEHMDRLVTEEARRRRAEEVLRRLEELPGFLDGDPGHAYQISPDKAGLLRRLIKVHTATIAGLDPGPQPGSPATPETATVLEAAQRVARIIDHQFGSDIDVTGALLIDSFRTADLAAAVRDWRDACTAAGILIPPEV